MQNLIENPKMKITFDITNRLDEFNAESLKKLFLNGLDSWANSLQSIIDQSTEPNRTAYLTKAMKNRQNMRERLLQFSMEDNQNIVAVVFDVKTITGITSSLQANFWQEKNLADFTPDEATYFDFIDGFGNEILVHIMEKQIESCLETGVFLKIPKVQIVLT